MNVPSPLTAALAAPLFPAVGASALAASELVAEGAAALLKSRRPDLLATLAGTPAPARPPARPSTTATTAKATTSAGYSSTATGDYAFLKDPKLSVDEKLFRFICTVAQKADDDLLKKMDEMKGGTAARPTSTSTAPKPKAFSLWGAAKALLPPLKLASKLVGDAGIKSLLKQVSGPVLAAACTAVGLPMLAPLAAKVGPQLASSLADAVESAVNSATGATGGTSSSGASTGTSSSGSAKNEQVQMMELQRLVDKQKEMFSLVSNIMKSTHDTRMAVIGNVR
jgi:hypothetical protein